MPDDLRILCLTKRTYSVYNQTPTFPADTT